MTTRTTRYLSLLAAGAVTVLMWPGPASAATSLGGYSGLAQAEPIRIQIYEPVIPIPTTPQVDGGIGYTKSTTDTGPVSRATASYFWPGDTVGDGFGQLTGHQSDKYPVQVNSRFPATADSPATNTAQLTTGNGMTTSSDETTTRATVTGLGVAGPGTDLLGGLGQGLSQLGGSSAPSVPKLPVPVSAALASIATVQNMKSISSVVVGPKTVTSSAQAYMSQVNLLGGLIALDGIDVTSTTVSDGKKATTSGEAKFGGISIAGQTLAMNQDGFQLAGSTVKLPAIPDAVTSLLAKLGIAISYLQTTHQASGATGSFTSTALQITIDTNPLKDALNIGALVGPLQQLLEKIPQLGSQLAPLLNVGPKIVLYIGSVQTSATAAPAWDGGGGGPGTPGGTGSTPGGTGGTGGGSGTGGGGGTGGGLTGGSLPGGTVNPATTTGGGGGGSGTGSVPTALQPTSFEVPGLGSVPRMLLLGGIVLAAVVGWLFRALGGFLLGGARSCRFGLPSGVPDLRKG